MSEYYQERDVYDGEYLGHLAKVARYNQELKDKIKIEFYELFSDALGGGYGLTFHQKTISTYEVILIALSQEKIF